MTASGCRKDLSASSTSGSNHITLAFVCQERVIPGTVTFTVLGPVQVRLGVGGPQAREVNSVALIRPILAGFLLFDSVEALL